MPTAETKRKRLPMKKSVRRKKAAKRSTESANAPSTPSSEPLLKPDMSNDKTDNEGTHESTTESVQQSRRESLLETEQLANESAKSQVSDTNLGESEAVVAQRHRSSLQRKGSTKRHSVSTSQVDKRSNSARGRLSQAEKSNAKERKRLSVKRVSSAMAPARDDRRRKRTIADERGTASKNTLRRAGMTPRKDSCVGSRPVSSKNNKHRSAVPSTSGQKKRRVQCKTDPQNGRRESFRREDKRASVGSRVTPNFESKARRSVSKKEPLVDKNRRRSSAAGSRRPISVKGTNDMNESRPISQTKRASVSRQKSSKPKRGGYSNSDNKLKSVKNEGRITSGGSSRRGTIPRLHLTTTSTTSKLASKQRRKYSTGRERPTPGPTGNPPLKDLNVAKITKKVAKSTKRESIRTSSPKKVK